MDRTETVHIGRHTAGAPHEQRRVTANLARAVAHIARQEHGPRKAVASPNDADELAWAVSPHGDPWRPTAFRVPKATIGMA